MSKPYAQYVEWDEHNITKIKCMKCADIIATRNLVRHPKTGVLYEKLVHHSHSKPYQVTLQDGSYSNMLVCRKCSFQITDLDLPVLQKTQRWGWQAEWEFKYKKKISLSYLKKLLKNKDITKRGL